MSGLDIYLIVFLIIGGISAIIAQQIAADKGRSSTEGFFYGLLLGVFGIIIIALLPENEDTLSQTKITNGSRKKCPYCAEVIKSEAIVCRFCGKEIFETEINRKKE